MQCPVSDHSSRYLKKSDLEFLETGKTLTSRNLGEVNHLISTYEIENKTEFARQKYVSLSIVNIYQMIKGFIAKYWISLSVKKVVFDSLYLITIVIYQGIRLKSIFDMRNFCGSNQVFLG